MTHKPISVSEYVKLYLKDHPSTSSAEVVLKIQHALAAWEAGARCACGEALWVLGSAENGLQCFECRMGKQADPSDHFEFDEAMSHESPKA